MRLKSAIIGVIAFIGSIAHAQSAKDYVLCNMVNKGKKDAVVGMPLSFDVKADGHSISNVHASVASHARRIIILQDISGSLRNGDAKKIQSETIRDFLATIFPEDQLGLVDFNDQYYLDIAPQNGAAFSRQYNDPSFQRKIDYRGGTALFDALVATASYLAQQPHEGDSIVVISDGGDNASHVNAKASGETITALKTRVYMLILPEPGAGYSRSNPSAMLNLVKDTGGLATRLESSKDFVQRWTQTVYSLIKTPERIDFEITPRILSPVRLNIVLSLEEDKRDKTVELVCPRQLGVPR